MVVQTEFVTGAGVLRLTDALVLGAGERGHRTGYASRTCWFAAWRRCAARSRSRSSWLPGWSTGW